MMVAVNDGSAVQYLLTDHLGSTVAVTDSSGTLTSQQRYLPFGGERAIPNSPILATDFGYTGQRLLDSGMGGIMDYKARFYSPYINRFLQPDSIIPNASNPQTWNKYSYVYNRPINLNDPSGHCGEGSVPSEGVSQTRHEWLCELRDKALELSLQVENGEIENDVEALAQFVEFAAPHYIRRGGRGGYSYADRNALANDTGIVLGGNEFTFLDGAVTILQTLQGGNIPTGGQIANAATNRCGNSDYSPDDMCQYYTGFFAFESEGFIKPDYYEEGGNQVAHFAGGLSALGNTGGLGMQVTIDQETNPPDKRLFEAALDLWESNTSITDWGDWIRENLMQKKPSPKLYPAHIPY
ncbi:MAG: RHS repeat-associated core domain-containing protein [Anaerolineales bacterium]|nr:RHS repeat-associated core domain-containing protein [Anaerolineales bacterium]